MSAPSNRNANGTESTQPGTVSVDADLALLANLLSTDADESEPGNVAELLKRLEAAEGFMGGMEDRLDNIIDHLDDLLDDLQARQSSQSSAQPSASAGAEKENDAVESRPAHVDTAQK